MVLFEHKGSREAHNNDIARNSPMGHRRRVYPGTDGSELSSTLLPTTFSPPGKSNRFLRQQLRNNPCSSFFLGGAFYPGKDKKRRQLKRRTLWYRLLFSSPWRRTLSFMIAAYVLFSSVIKPLASSFAGYGSLIASSRRRQGLHGTWLLYDESLLSNIRTVEEERAEALRLSNEQTLLQFDSDRRQKTLERIVPGWYHRNDENAGKSKVVEEKVKEAERLTEEREGKDEKHAHQQPHEKSVEKMNKGMHQPPSKDQADPAGLANTEKLEPGQALQEGAEKRRLVNASSENTSSVRTIHNMQAFRNQSRCPSTMSSADIRITLVLQSTPERLWILRRTCQRWKDPIVLVVFFDSEEAMASAQKKIRECPQLRIIHHLSDPNYAEDGKEKYPVNRLRNIGLDAVQTSHILMADIDFVPSQGLPRRVRAAIVERNEWRNDPLGSPAGLPGENIDAIVVPAFERIPPSEICRGADCTAESQEDLMNLSIPSSFDELRSCVVERKECRVFQIHNNKDGHSSTRSLGWLNGIWYEDDSGFEFKNVSASQISLLQHNASGHVASMRSLHCFDSVRYEPYVVLRWCPASPDNSQSRGPVAPYYDERFHGYGKNKIEMISHLRVLGYSFSVLPEGFIIHAPHSISQAKKAWESTKESSLHRSMDELYPAFLKELLAIHKHEKRKMIKQC